MYCKHCGKKIPENSKFCRFCGKDLNVSKSKTKSSETTGQEKIQFQDENQEQTNFISNYLNVIKKYVDFSGRASRREYWMFILVSFAVALILGFVEGLFGIYPESDESILASIYQLFILLPTISVGVRRMHDADKSGWVLIIPLYNLIISLRKGNPKTNEYGSPPEY
ncbi:DUF805 domain-containing protein [Candidatus Woesebacteria bacterium]|nr:DUF805 domain-containing protein [Candidatus Woesebacteria bacterium]MCD8527595.1 DUF805 domain-containing protein [Candidatus Woesebacteria bacterium]MCD8546433.1 DUF805 domain-containing protein [Candidatus Woesebacteria bacterium]